MRNNQNFSLMVPWISLGNRTETQIRQDLLTAPLQFGPIAILDNMIMDNPQLFRVFCDTTYYNLAEKYIKTGLLTLWHRPSSPDGKKIAHSDDLLRIWFSRNSPAESETVYFGCLSPEANEEFKKVLRNNRNFIETKNIFFRNFAPPGMQDALQRIQELFFNENHPSARYSKDPINSRVAFIQNRFAQGIGVTTDKIDWKRAAQDIALQLWANRYCYNNFLSPEEWKLFIEEADIAEPLFKNILSNRESDAGRVNLRNAVAQYENAGEEGVRLSKKLKYLVDAIFVRGYPEMYGIDVIDIPYSGENELDESQYKLVGASSSDQNRLADTIINALVIKKNYEPLQTFLSNKTDNKKIMEHLDKFRRDIFGEHNAGLRESDRKEIKSNIIGRVINNTVLGAGTIICAEYLPRDFFVSLLTYFATDTSYQVMKGAKILIKGRLKKSLFNVSFSKERPTAYKEFIGYIKIE